MKPVITSMIVIVAALSCSSPSRAAEQERDVAGPAPDPEAISLGYQMEAGVSSTHLGHGAPKWDGRFKPGTEDLAALRVKNLGGGLLTGGSSFALALGPTPMTRRVSMEVHPFALFVRDFGALRTETGVQANFYPRAVQPRGEVEGIFRWSMLHQVLTPFVELFPEVVARGGAYVAAGVERGFSPTRRLALAVRISAGAQAYIQGSERVHGQDVTVAGAAKLVLTDGVYVALRPAYGTGIAPAERYADASLAGRSFGYVNLSVGFER